MSTGQTASRSFAGASASAGLPMATNISQGRSNAATASDAHDPKRRGEAAPLPLGERASRITNTSMSTVVAAADSCDATPGGGVAKQGLDRQFGEGPAGQRQSGEAEAKQRRDDQRQRSGAAVERGDRAGGQEQSGLHQHMIGRVERHLRRCASVRAASAMPSAAAITPIWLMLE